MNEQEFRLIQCPYCGEQIELLIDCSVEQQNYIEDCHVCCRPITLDINTGYSGELLVHARHENE